MELVKFFLFLVFKLLSFGKWNDNFKVNNKFGNLRQLFSFQETSHNKLASHLFNQKCDKTKKKAAKPNFKPYR